MSTKKPRRPTATNRTWWTDDEKAALRKCARFGSTALRKALPRRTHGAIRLKACAMGISIATVNVPWSDELIAEMGQMIKRGITYKKIAKKLGRSEKSIQAKVHFLKKAGVTFQKPERKKPKHQAGGPAKPQAVRGTKDIGRDCSSVTQRVSPANEWRLDHPVVGRSVFDLGVA